jgi:serralysin
MINGSWYDAFRFSRPQESIPNAPDWILDFTPSVDVLDFSRFDGNSFAVGRQALLYIGSEPFFGLPGQLRFDAGFLSAYINGDMQPDFSVFLANVTSLSASDMRGVVVPVIA